MLGEAEQKSRTQKNSGGATGGLPAAKSSLAAFVASQLERVA